MTECAESRCDQPATRRWRTHCTSTTYELCDEHTRASIAFSEGHVLGMCDRCKRRLSPDDFADLGPLGVRPA